MLKGFKVLSMYLKPLNNLMLSLIYLFQNKLTSLNVKSISIPDDRHLFNPDSPLAYSGWNVHGRNDLCDRCKKSVAWYWKLVGLTPYKFFIGKVS